MKHWWTLGLILVVTVAQAGRVQVVGPGDIDLDGDATVSDAIKILRIVVGLDSPSALERFLADADGDGAINVGDAVTVLRAVVGLTDWPLPWPGGGPPMPPITREWRR